VDVRLWLPLLATLVLLPACGTDDRDASGQTGSTSNERTTATLAPFDSDLIAFPCSSGEPPNTREEALACAPATYDVAVAQGYDGPCIYNGGRGNWSVVIDRTGNRTFLEAVKLCGYEPKPGDHAVVLDGEGDVRRAR
jgi:hypothetical protein